MKTWFSMSVLDLLCAVPAFLIASSLHKTLIRNRLCTPLTGLFLQTHDLDLRNLLGLVIGDRQDKCPPEQNSLLSKH